MPNRSFHILMLAPQLGYGGAEKSFIRLANQLSRWHMVTIALFTQSYTGTHYTDEKLQTSCPVIILDTEKESKKIGRLRRWLNRWQRFSVLKKQHDIAISFLSGSNLLNVCSARYVPSIVSERGSKRYDTGPPTHIRLLWNRFLDPLIYRFASAVVAASYDLAQEIISVSPRTLRRKVWAIEGTIESERLIEDADAEIEKSFEVFMAYDTIIACGRMHPQKGFQYLIPIFAKISKNNNKARLLLIGDGPMYESYVTLAEEQGLTVSRNDDYNLEKDQVVFAGHRKSPIRYFRLGKIFAFTSLYEGLPNILIEAIASGCQVLATDCPWGVRSVLARDKKEQDNAPNRIEKPVPMSYGTLMPAIDKGRLSYSVWCQSLGESLQVTASPIVPKENRKMSVARFDIAKTVHEWEAVVKNSLSSEIE